jgi:4-diphosphocytidyl-2-C-methyl-D-erythritol kinase
LRTIFQTISLADHLEIDFTPARKTVIDLDDPLGIADNLVTRAALLAMQAIRATGHVGIKLRKRIPMGAGLGGGSSDAAAILLALPALAGRVLGLPAACEIAQQLGSDVPFFLLGGTAVGIGRGSEVFPLPDSPRRSGVLITPGFPVSTAQAYRDLSARLTTESEQNKIFSFQLLAWGGGVSAANDFEAVVFEQHPRLAILKRKLARAGATEALMTGSGSAVFGLFRDRNGASRALGRLGDEQVFPFSLVTRTRYRRMWWQALAPHIEPEAWPPRSRHTR